MQKKTYLAVVGVVRNIELGKLDEVSVSFRRALEIDPDRDEAMLGLGQLCGLSGEIKAAEDLYEKALEINPGNIVGRYTLSNVRKVKTGDENMASAAGNENCGHVRY